MIHDGAAMNFRPAPRDAIRHWLALSLPLTRRPFETDFPNRESGTTENASERSALEGT